MGGGRRETRNGKIERREHKREKGGEGKGERERIKEKRENRKGQEERGSEERERRK
jgi:hypothetical protein